MHASGGTHAKTLRPEEGFCDRQHTRGPSQGLDEGVQYCPGEQTYERPCSHFIEPGAQLERGSG